MLAFGRATRVRVALIATLSLGGATIAAPPVASASQAASTKVSAKATASAPTAGATVHIKGSVNPTSTKRKVTLQRLLKGRWTTVSSSTTSKGQYALKVTTSRVGGYTYRVHAPAIGSYSAGTSGTVRITVVRKSSATMSASPNKTPIGSTARVKGTLSPTRAGRTVKAQMYDFDRKKWVTLATGKTTSKSTFSIPIKADHPKGWSLQLRAYAPATPGYASAVSPKNYLTLTYLLEDGRVSWTTVDGCMVWLPGDPATDYIGYGPATDAPDRCWDDDDIIYG